MAIYFIVDFSFLMGREQRASQGTLLQPIEIGNKVMLISHIFFDTNNPKFKEMI